MRVTIEPYGKTFEGRELVTVTITSPANHGRLAEIAEGARGYFDPRGKSAKSPRASRTS